MINRFEIEYSIELPKTLLTPQIATKLAAQAESIPMKKIIAIFEKKWFRN
jgi:hypothetical protein